MSDELHPLRCETCENIICKYNSKNRGYTITYHTDNIWEITKEIGCASHSSAQERINAVIKELEQRAKNAQILGGYPMMSVYEAIALLQRGEKK